MYYVVVQTDFESNFILKMGKRDLNSAIEITQKGEKSWKIGFCCCCNGFVCVPITYIYVLYILVIYVNYLGKKSHETPGKRKLIKIEMYSLSDLLDEMHCMCNFLYIGRHFKFLSFFMDS